MHQLHNYVGPYKCKHAKRCSMIAPTMCPLLVNIVQGPGFDDVCEIEGMAVCQSP